ncbi:MAG: hypothetical protein CSA51_00725 [Gammaproteobacteria bacterium]|nr:MAG: hypothetical protein CSA51_00725 [Gammaproteobacteria bacterium]
MSKYYQVIITGEVLPGFDSQQVAAVAAQLFKLSSAQAPQLLSKPRTVKKGVDAQTAERYLQKLKAIGLVAKTEPPLAQIGQPPTAAPARANEQAAQISPADTTGVTTVESNSETTTDESTTTSSARESGLAGLSLLPLEDEKNANTATDTSAASTHTIADASVVADAEKSISAPVAPVVSATDEVDDDIKAGFLHQKLIDDISVFSIIAGCAAALLGALAWRLIATAFDVELAFMAWIIGGVIGLAVTMTGSRGQMSGILCAILAVVAIMGGKYLAYSALEANAMAEIKAMLQPEFERMQTLAKTYDPNMDNAEFARFFSAYSNGEAIGLDVAADFSDAEVDSMRTMLEPQLNQIAGMDFNQWYETNYAPAMAAMQQMMDAMPGEGYSPWTTIRDQWSWQDILFLLLGVMTAFRVGRGNEG